ncbi:hypothetical protein LCGC14_2569390, partial [marine sediment metagenome]
MNSTHDHMKRWERIAEKLRAYRDEQQEVWGNMDDLTITRYLCDTCKDEEEERSVQQIMDEKPAVRELVEAVKAVLQPVWVSAAAAAAPPADWRHAPGKLLKNPLEAWIDQTGQLMARGLDLLMAGPEPLLGLGVAGVPMGPAG